MRDVTDPDFSVADAEALVEKITREHRGPNPLWALVAWPLRIVWCLFLLFLLVRFVAWAAHL
jgi:hypothetical protein